MLKLLTTTAIVAAAMPVAVHAQGQPARMNFDIKAGDTAAALNQFANQAHVHVVFPYDVVANQRVAGVRGNFTRGEALRRLIAGQGLLIARETAGMISLKAAPVAANAPLNMAADDSPQTDIIVLGQGNSRQVQTVAPKAMAKATAGSSPLRSLGRLPGVNFDSSDARGTYEAATQLSIRGFLSDQMGYTLDGVPLGNMQYRNNNGLSINRALLTENNGPATLSQGSGALGTASTSNIGGTVDFSSIDPTPDFGVDLEQSYGSENSWRSFIRINSGELPWGGRLALSYAHDRQGKWRGWGKQEQDQINVKYVQPIGDSVKSTTFLNLIDRSEDDYNDVSLAKLKTYGWDFDNIPTFALAEQLALIVQNGGTPPAPYVNADDSVYQGGGVRRDLLGYEKLEYVISNHLSGFTTAYLHLDKGIGTWANPYEPTPAAFGGSPVSVSANRYDIDRKGVISRLKFEAGQHRIEGGIWYEHNAFNQASYLYGLQAGVTPDEFQQFYSNPFKVNYQNEYRTDTVQVDISDTWQATDHLRLNAGFKGLVSTNKARSIVSTKPIDGSIQAKNWFLPTAGILYTLDGGSEVFAGYTRNMAAFVASTSSGPFSSSSQAGFNYIRGDLKPEMTNTFEAGYRFHNRDLQLSLTGYYVKFTNRLLASSISATVVGNQNVLQNVGSVSSRGVEAAANWKFAPFWSVYGSWAYNDATYDDNVRPLGGAVVATKGKQVVASPKHVGNLELNYDDGMLWGQAMAHYRSKRYYSYLNDATLPGAVNVNLSAGYRFSSMLDVQLNVMNLFDKRYIASTGTAGFVTSDPNGTYTTLQSAAPRQVFGTVRVHF
ncbi:MULTISPECIES: TonB-dependent receptor domain-containing protein [unclassified Sphingobium]|uniref:TonB-dependent receptor domain-containing protein n=1 Tax=unclassified Sphingobium TaxID=2611147 RepID=UPI000D164036|nr:MULTISPECIES: TonB-dependent receptor [unclassified Sphingobium]MBG6120528.1 iron complex outermembrane receptor protein [Sphingobium sp. JAI105]PSO10271.1 TonB-dependent receptor [Sphingobium sp. AEW4]TWD00634.1 iron complex outermembrane receptor protein [Sphingobium sp. AEW010]TWD19679.1 iron complex outermembrane receptor protein [Sphingobium sp. AEW013]TWD22264.1 iron complex outermembrane receptor protein [Sphingobium sp. AEW001]